jgi:hypothetical protein
MPPKAWFTSHCRNVVPKPQNGRFINIPQIHSIFPLILISADADFQWESIEKTIRETFVELNEI